MMPAQLLTTAMTNCDTSVTTVLLSHSTSLVQFNSDDDNLQYYPGFNSFIYRKVKKFQALMFYFRSEWGWKKTMIRKDFFDLYMCWEDIYRHQSSGVVSVLWRQVDSFSEVFILTCWLIWLLRAIIQWTWIMLSYSRVAEKLMLKT